MFYILLFSFKHSDSQYLYPDAEDLPVLT